MVKYKNLEKATKCCCLIILKNLKNEIIKGSGFFMIIENFRIKSENNPKHAEHFLLTNYHVISEDLIKSKIEIILELNDNKRFNLKLDISNRFIKCYEKPTDISNY